MDNEMEVSAMDGLILWVRAQVDDDERAALAEAQGKRQILDRAQFVEDHGPARDNIRALDMTTGARSALRDVVRYAGRPGWREDWVVE